MEKSVSLKTAVYDAVLDSVIRGEFAPGQILNEKDLIQKYGCSKSPVREALISLCGDRVLENIPRCGYMVVHLTVSDAVNVLSFRLAVEEAFMREYYLNLTGQDLTLLEEINRKDAQMDGDVWEHWELNAQFHLTLMSFSGNQYAYQQIEESMHVLKRVYAQCYRTRWSSVKPGSGGNYHKAILDGLREHDIETAVANLRLDLQDFYR
ncbi:hypothetical protein SDC9_82361 [bioreactor metagenome]|uniref:HTH gntR-type domain-containing protein n=1 Tax=bioreactor metagenome TaxID=1076179 RepID=A0A644Z583_9ZZZZ